MALAVAVRETKFRYVGRTAIRPVRYSGSTTRIGPVLVDSACGAIPEAPSQRRVTADLKSPIEYRSLTMETKKDHEQRREPAREEQIREAMRAVQRSLDQRG
jgi:hypothetical protein